MSLPTKFDVARRLLARAAISFRSDAEGAALEGIADAADFIEDLRSWAVTTGGAARDLSASESDFLTRPIGKLSQQELIDGS